MNPQALPSVEVIVLNWNGRAYLPDCLAALGRQDYANFKITVIDNDSTDGSAEWVRATFPHVRLVMNPINLGFAAGNNVALATAKADFVALLNPDVVAAADWLSQLVAALTQDDRTGIVGSKLWYPDGRTIQHGGGYVRPVQAMPGHYAIGEADTGQADAPREVEYVIGAATAVRRETLQEIGLFDEGYFLYYEDVDLCLRAHQAGWKVVYAPQATAVHVESATAIKDSFAYLHRFHTGRWRTLLKHSPADMLLSETLPAERDWLRQITPQECLAAALAYHVQIAGWDEVLSARRRQGAGALPPDLAAELHAQVVGLQGAALTAVMPLVGQVVTAEPPPESALHAAMIPIVGQLTENTQRTHEAVWQLAELHMIRDAQQTETRQLAHAVGELGQQLDELEARLVALGRHQSR